MTRLIANRYEVLETLHTGGLKAVHRIIDRRAPLRPLVLKELIDERSESRGLIRFHNEYRIARDLAHPSIPAVVSFGWEEDPEHPFFVEEFVSGESALELEALPEADLLVEVLTQAARVLGYLHARNLVHFDVKPDNLILERDPLTGALGRLRLVDFDLAGPAGPGGAGRGTMPYIAPEVRSGAETIDGRADLYSLGASLVAMIAGSHPDDLPLDPDPRSLVEYLPEGAEERYGLPILSLIHGLLRSHPDERPVSAREVLLQLAEIRPGHAVEDVDDRLASIVRPRFVGRLNELSRMRTLLPGARSPGEQLEDLAPRFVLVTGERGVGKSRFLDQHLVNLETSRRVVLRLIGDPGRPHEDAASLRMLDLELASALGETTDDSSGYTEIGDPRRFLFFSALASRMIRFATERAPLCFVAEDLHALGRLSREFVAYALRRIGSEAQASISSPSLQIVLVAVPGPWSDRELERIVNELREEGALETIELDPLERDRTAELIDAMASPDSAFPAFAERLHERTHGNPLFIRESVANLMVQEGEVLGAEVALRPERLGVASIPTKVRGVVQSRVGRVSAVDLELLQLLALHPLPADVALSAAVGELAVDEARATFERLVQGGLLAMNRLDVPTFVDSDARDIVTAMMSEGRRQALHGRWALALDREGMDEGAWARPYHRLRTGESSPELWDLCLATGRDLTGGGRDAEAARLFEAVLDRREEAPPFLVQRAALEKAELCRRRFEPKRARTLLELHLTPELRRTVECTLIEARSLGMEGRYQEARERLHEATEAAFSARHWAGAARLTLHRAETLLVQGHLPDTETALDEAGQLLERLNAVPAVGPFTDEPLADIQSPALPPLSPHAELQAVLVRLRADFEFKSAQLPRALALALLSVKMEAREGNLPGLGKGLHLVGTIFMKGGINDEAESHFRRALDLHRDVFNLKAQADTLNNLGILMRRQNKSGEAIKLLEEALELRREIGHRQGEVDCWLNIATIHTQRRELSAAAKAFKVCLRLKRKLPENNNPGVILNNLGVVAQLRDRLAAALRYYREAAGTERSFGNEAAALVWEVNEGLALASAGNWGTASARFDAVELGLKERQLQGYSGYVGWGRADVAIGTGQWATAEEKLGEALEFFTNEEDEASRLESLVRLFELHLRRSRFERARWVLGALDDADLSDLAPEVKQRLAGLELWLYVEEGRPLDEPPECLEVVMLALRESQQAKMPSQAFIAAFALAYYHDRADRRERAFYFYNIALEHLEGVLDAIGDHQYMGAWLETPVAKDFRRRSREFIQRCMPGHEDDLRRLPFEVRNAVGGLKRGFFDLERELNTTVSNMRRNEEGVRRILEIGQSLSGPVGKEVLLERIADGVVDFARAERGFLILIEDGEPRVAVARTTRGEPVGDPLRQISTKALAEIIRTRRPILLQNAMEEGEYRGRQSVVDLALRSIMAVPMLRQEELVGILYVENRSRIGQFQPSDLELLAILASQAAIAIENASLVHDFIREERMRMLGTMSGGVAHDFNNLLAVIQGRVQLMGRREPGADLAQDLEILAMAARDGAAVARRLQDFSQDKAHTEMITVELRGLVGDVFEFTRPHWASEGIRRETPLVLENRVPEGLTVKAQPSELREVLMNVLLNELSALEKGGEIVFDAKPGDSVLHLSVRMRGPGLRGRVAGNSIDPMHSNRDRPGGLGMSVAYGILLRHGGRVRIEAEDELGYAVLIDLPSGEPLVASAPSSLGPTFRPAAASPGSRILIVDDEAGVRELLEEILEDSGYDVVNAASGPEALDAFDDRPCDLVITDLGMVPMSGWDLAREIKMRDEGVSVILLTGYAGEEELADAAGRSVDQVMAKPFDVDALLEVVAARVR